MKSKALHIQSLSVSYGEQAVIEDLNLTVEPGEMLAILGPSGCGKTTLLRTIAGLVQQKSGRIALGERDIQNLPPQDRKTSLVFQNYALFPHMSVEENVAYGLKIRKEPPESIRRETDKILDLVDLSEQKKKRVQEISGGQQQRVALARSLVIHPDLMLFDEPLSNLDEKLRDKMRRDIRRLQRDLDITGLYVTHDQKEALSIADRIVVMDQGEIQQIDTPDALYHRPANELVARFMGHNNVFSKKELSLLFPEMNQEEAGTHTLIPAQAISLGGGPYQAIVRSREVRGYTVHYQLERNRFILEAVCINHSHVPAYADGESVPFSIELESLVTLG